jgi:hypothetical protein
MHLNTKTIDGVEYIELRAFNDCYKQLSELIDEQDLEIKNLKSEIFKLKYPEEVKKVESYMSSSNEDLITIKKITKDNHDHAAVKYNLKEDVSMSFIQEAVFAVIVTAIRPLEEEQKHRFVQSIKDNMSKLDLVNLSKMTNMI